jgi:hypothetical protein
VLYPGVSAHYDKRVLVSMLTYGETMSAGDGLLARSILQLHNDFAWHYLLSRANVRAEYGRIQRLEIATRGNPGIRACCERSRGKRHDPR